MKKILFLGLVLLSLFLIGCQEGVKGVVIAPQEPEIRTIIIEEELVKEEAKMGRPEQAEMFLKKLNALYISERGMLRKMYESYVDKLKNSCDNEIGLCSKNWEELIDYAEEEEIKISELKGGISDEILNKGQYTDVDLADLYKQLSKELSTKAQEGRVRLTDFYGKLSLLPRTSTITSDYECSYNKYNCADFNSQAEAQAVMIYCGNDDIHYLDGDDDGIACESLP